MTNFEPNPQNMTYSVGGTVQASGGYYVERQADGELLALCLAGEFAYVLTARQMGKSSLMIRTAEQLRREEGPVTPVIVDLQAIGTPQDREEWYFGFVLAVAEQLEVGAGLGTDLYDWWDAQRGVGITQRLTRFFQQVVLREVVGRVVVFVDEIDSTLTLDYTDDFFIAIRYCFTARAENPEFKRLSFVLLGVATPGDLIIDSKRTPFNIGRRVELADFSRQEADPLKAGLGLPPEQVDGVFDGIYGWTGGHPYLTQRLCGAVDGGIDGLVESLFLGEGSEKDNHLQFVRDMLLKRAPGGDGLGVLQVYRDVLRGREVVDEEQSILKNHLKLAGIVRVGPGKRLVVRNRIYEQVFDGGWLRKHWPLNLWGRLKLAWPVVVASVGVTVVVSGLGLVAYRNAQQLETALTESQLREQAAVVLNWLPTLKAPRGLVLALQTYEKSDEKKLSDSLLRTTESSLLSALQQARESNIFQGHTAPVGSVAFSPDGKSIVSGSDDNSVRLWDLQGNPIGQPFQGHTDSVRSVAFSPDGKSIVSGSFDNSVRLWDLQGNPIGQPFQGHTASVLSVAFSPDGKSIVSGSFDNSVRLWDLQGNPIGQPFQGHTASVWSVAFSPDGKSIVSGSDDNSVRLWDLQGNPIGQPFQGHTDSVRSVAFSPDGKSIVSGSFDNSVRLWDLQGNPIGQPFQGHTAYVLSVAFSPDGKSIVSGSADGTLRLWHASPDSWFRIGCNRLRYHPLFTRPETEIPNTPDLLRITQEARQACQDRVWSQPPPSPN